MTAADIIYKKSLTLSEQQSQEVIHFIDFIKNRFYTQPEFNATSREQALAHLSQVKIHWQGKPIGNRDELYDDCRA